MWEKLAEMFDDGDILYGLDRGRGAAKRAILDYRSRVSQRRLVFCCVPWTTSFERIVIQNDITNAVFDPAKEGGLQTDKQIKKDPHIKSDPQRAIAFRDFVKAHPKYNLDGYQPGPATAVPAWLKTSKAGLEFQARRRGRIHFVLDGLGYDRVLAQDAVSGARAKVKVSRPLEITSAEVRWLFRHRRDADVTAAVTFWNAGEPSAAPWDQPAHREAFANFLYTRDQILADEGVSGFQVALRQLKAALLIQRLYRKKKGGYYVRVGDTLASIAQAHGVSTAQLRQWNGLENDNVALGQVLQVQAPRPAEQPAARGSEMPRQGQVQEGIRKWENLANS